MKNFLSVIVVLTFLFAACSSSTGKQSAETRMAQNSVETVSKGPISMQPSEVKETFQYKGKNYQSHVVRRPDNTLPLVTNNEQQQFVDNVISVKLTCDGKQILSRTFTKKDFLYLVDAAFAQQAILEGIVFNETSDAGICYAASLGHPESDLYQPIRMVVTPSGTLSIALEEELVELVEEQTQAE